MGDLRLEWGSRTFVMGIVNVSPDSFAGDGLTSTESSVRMASRMVQDGADFIDVGGESTRPGSAPIPLAEEMERVIPAIREIRRAVSVPISVDTYKYDVAVAALKAGASVINDIWGLKHDPRLADVAAAHGAAMVLMANQRDISPRHDVDFQDIVAVVLDDLARAAATAMAHGVAAERIIVDPGIGFGKTQPQNLTVLRRLGELKALGYPLLVGTSRKSVLGHVLQLPASERLEATAATVALAIERGADIVRVHDVKEMWRVCRVADAIVRDR